MVSTKEVKAKNAMAVARSRTEMKARGYAKTELWIFEEALHRLEYCANWHNLSTAKFRTALVSLSAKDHYDAIKAIELERARASTPQDIRAVKLAEKLLRTSVKGSIH